jgi:8-oxo-dGTP diphosphatase
LSDIAPLIPRIGVAVIVQRDDRVLLGLRRSSTHGDGVWQFPGGHLEYGETVEACAVRETLEETGLSVRVVARGPWTNDVFADSARHYVTLFMLATVEAGEAEVREPNKCAEWRWFRWDALPTSLFLSIRHLLDDGWRPSS